MSNLTVGHPRSASVPHTKTGNDPRYRLRLVEQAIAGCPDRYFVTFTSKWRMDDITWAEQVGKSMFHVNSQLYGTHFKRRGVRLYTMAVQERTKGGNLHTHMLVGVPEGSLALKANPCPTAVPELIVSTWVSGDHQYRRAGAQDARDVYDFSGARSYISKGLRTLADFDNYDVLNTYASIPA